MGEVLKRYRIIGQSCLSDQKGPCTLFQGELLPFGPWLPETVIAGPGRWGLEGPAPPQAPSLRF